MESQRNQAYRTGYEQGQKAARTEQAAQRKTVSEAVHEGAKLAFAIFREVIDHLAEEPDPISALCRAFNIQHEKKNTEADAQ